MIRIGWLSDVPKGYQGGAELEAAALVDAAPVWAEVIPCPPGEVSSEADAYVVHNCVSYDRDILPLLERRPVIKRVHDLWPHGDPALRAWLLANARRLFFSSPLHREAMRWRITAPVSYLPSAVDVERFRGAAQVGPERQGVIWLGRLFPGKGLRAAWEWAVEREVLVDTYGAGPLEEQVQHPMRRGGQVSYAEVPELLARYKTLLFLPDEVEPFGRTVVEAWAAGCTLVVNGNIGALWWLEHHPAAVGRGAELFWETVREVVAA